MPTQPKQMRIKASRTLDDRERNLTQISLKYGKSTLLSKVHDDDFADFITGIREGFKDVVVEADFK